MGKEDTSSSSRPDQKKRKKKRKKKKTKHLDAHKDTTDTTIQPGNNDDATRKSSSPGWSWGSAFAAVSKVQPNDADLDDKFLKVTASTPPDEDGLLAIASLIKSDVNDSSNKKKKRKRSDSNASSSDDDIDNTNDSNGTTLEGRMISISDDNDINGMALVLVDKQSGEVYSSGERTKEGNRLVIGKLVKGNKVEIDQLAVQEMKALDEGNIISSQLHAVEMKGPSFPYPTNEDDHCETPLQSYKDILPILNELCNKDFGGKKDRMKIYDPYFCDGGVIKKLSSLGYSNVYNRKEDCYEAWESTTEPQYDVFLTNPPYSDQHMDKLMRKVSSPSFGNKPWLLLMPQFVHKKDYYINSMKARQCNPFYIVPKKRYIYSPPRNFREKKASDVHKKSSPFISMWYCWGGNEKQNGELMNAFRNSSVMSDCDLARSKSALRDLRRGSGAGGSNKKKKKKRVS